MQMLVIVSSECHYQETALVHLLLIVGNKHGMGLENIYNYD